MISLEAIEQDILELESRDTTFATLSRLSPLYIAVIYDWIRHTSIDKHKPLEITGDSDFLRLVNGRSSDQVWAIMDELMQAVQALHPRMYEKVMDRIRAS